MEISIDRLGPEQFLISNEEEYYCWYLPYGRRGKLSLTEEGLVYEQDGEKVIYATNQAPASIAGVVITGYLISTENHTGFRRLPLFVSDTLYDLSDPYSKEDARYEPGRVTSMSDFMTEFYKVYPCTLDITSQSLYGMNMKCWYDRIDTIWQRRVTRHYPVVGLVLWSRDNDRAYIWRDIQRIEAFDGSVTVLRPLTFNNRKLNDEVWNADNLDHADSTDWLDWNDISGNSNRLVEWAMDSAVESQILQLRLSAPTSDLSVIVPTVSAARLKRIEDNTGATVIPSNDIKLGDAIRLFVSQTMTLAPRQVKSLLQH